MIQLKRQKWTERSEHKLCNAAYYVKTGKSTMDMNLETVRNGQTVQHVK